MAVRLNLAIRCVLTCLALVAATFGASSLHAQSQGEGPLFVRASVDNGRPYIGQQVTYAVRIYQRSDFTQRLRYFPPGFEGFWNSQPVQRDEYTEAIGSEEYRVIELRTLLFPSVVGVINIEPTSLKIDAEPPGPSDSRESEAVMVEVRSLPTGAPRGFVGAVGRFEISADVNSTSGTVNEPVLLTVTITGEGNVEALPDPIWPDFSGWRAIESLPNAEARVVDGTITGSRIYEIGLVPDGGGDLAIPEIVYPIYDPELGRYVQAATAPITVTVGGGSPLSVSGDTVAEQTQSVVRGNKPVPPTLERWRRGLTDSPVYWSSWIVPLLVIVGAVMWRRRLIAREATLATFRQRNALRNARAVLTRSGSDPRVAASDAILSYMSDRLDAPAGGLTHDSLQLRLLEAGASSDLAQRVEDTLARGDAARYSPVADGVARAEDTVERASRLLTDLEEVLEE